MTAHASLTGANLHEPKGASTASIDTLYSSDGAGSGAWVKVDSANIDTTSIFLTNKHFLSVTLADVSAASSVWVPVIHACTLNKVTTALQGAITTADSILTVANTAGTTIGTITVAFSGSAAGDIDTLTASSNNTFSANTFVKITSDGGSSTTMPLIITLEFTATA